MRRLALIFAGVLGALLVATGIVAAFLFRTPAGHSVLASIIEDPLGAALGGEARIGALSGAPPGHVILNDVRLIDAKGQWLAIDRIELRWRPLEALGRRIEIDALHIAGAVLSRPPAAEDDADPQGRVDLPERLPNVRIAEFRLDNFSTTDSLTDVPLRIDGVGALSMGGKALSLNFTANSERERDYVAVNIDIDPKSGRGLVDGILLSQPDGVIAALLNADGPVFVEASADAPLESFSLQYESKAGDWGAMTGVIASNLTEWRSATLSASLQPGDALADARRILGPQIDLRLALERRDDGGVLKIAQASAAPGRIEGTIAWRNARDVLQRLDARLAFNAAADFSPDLQALLGDEASLSATAMRAANRYRLRAGIKTPFMTARIADATTDLRSIASARVEATMERNPDAPSLLRDGASVTMRARIERDEARIEKLAASAASGAVIAGAGVLDRTKQRAALNLSATLKPEALAALAAGARADGDMKAVLRMNGPLDDWRGILEARTPSISVGGTPFPAATARAELSDMLGSPNAGLEIVAADRSRRLAARLAFDAAAGALAIDRFRYAGADFVMTGDGAFSDAQSRLQLRYEGADGAEPWPGLAVSGEALANVALSRTNGAVLFDAAALRFGGTELRNVRLSGEGSVRSLTFTARAADVHLPMAAPMTNLEGAGEADLEARAIRITKLSGEIGAAPFALMRPATIVLPDQGFRIENVRLEIGDDGEAALDATIEPDRWTGAFNVKDLPLGAANSLVSGKLDLDTRRPMKATGAVALRSLLIEGDAAAANLAISWDGRRIRVADDGTSPVFAVDLSAPAVLNARDGALGVAFDGAISGSAEFDGQLQSLAAYLPAPIQTAEGDLKIHMSVSGTLDNPEISGAATLRNGAFTDPASGLAVMDIDAAAEARSGGASVTFNASASGAGQTIKSIFVDGAVALAKRSPSVRARIRLDEARLSAPPVSSAVLNGEVNIAGSLDAMTAEGRIAVAELNALLRPLPRTDLVPITVIAEGDVQMPAAAPPARSSPLALDVRISANDRIFVRGRGLESEWSADIVVSGDAAQPTLVGPLTMRRGRLDFAGRRFDVKRGLVRFDRTERNDPVLDIRAEYKAEEVTAMIEISGRSSSPRVTLSSNPALPESDVMALVLFGKPATELSALESLQVAQALAQLGGVGPFGNGEGLGGTARRALGLDILNLDLGEDAAASSLEIGKYVADGVFVSATQDARGERGAVRLQYEIAPSITVETEIRQDGDQTVSANWKRDF